MTVNVSLDADSDTVIYVNGKRTDHLDQSWTSTHVMEFAHVGRQRGYSIISDKVIDEQDPPEYADASDKLPTEDKTPASLDENGALESEALNKAQTYAFGDNSVGVNYIKAMNYADKWTSPENKDKMNPAYPSFGPNCTNFVSQALHQGGMTLTRLWNYSTVMPDKLTTRAWMNAIAAYRNFCGALDWFSLSVGGVGVSRGGVEFVPVDAGPVCGRDAVVRFGRRCLFALPQGVGDE